MFGSYLMFHYVRGVPFEFNAGAYDNLNMWEQIDNGDQYTPAKKFLLSVPIVLFLLSTHYTNYETSYFTINFLAVLGVVIPKLPSVSPIQCSRNTRLVHDWTKLEINPEPSHAVWVVFGEAGGSIALGESFFGSLDRFGGAMAWKSPLEHERRLAGRASVNITSFIHGSIRRLRYPVSGG